MPSPEHLKEAERLMVICNACRYCSGYCGVFPAMERRRTFTKQDLVYLSNLCFECRACLYACQYAPPHEFGVNVPKVFAELRVDTCAICTIVETMSSPAPMRRRSSGTICSG